VPLGVCIEALPVTREYIDRGVGEGM
jgi:hypothetical protein